MPPCRRWTCRVQDEQARRAVRGARSVGRACGEGLTTRQERVTNELGKDNEMKAG